MGFNRLPQVQLETTPIDSIKHIQIWSSALSTLQLQNFVQQNSSTWRQLTVKPELYKAVVDELEHLLKLKSLFLWLLSGRKEEMKPFQVAPDPNVRCSAKD